MKPLSDQNHYEILEVAQGATLEQIERAFRMAESTYADDSLAGYSVFGEGEAEAIRERVAIAYRVLSDPEARAAYDAEIGAPARGDAPASVEHRDHDGLRDAPPVAPIPVVNIGDLETLDALEEEDGEFDGASLRRSRLRSGVEIEDISRITKISPSYLRFIEENRYSDLPPRVYVRGFVRAYADCVGLDANRVVASYMKKYEADLDRATRGRFPVGR